MNRTETLADIAARYPAIPASVAEAHGGAEGRAGMKITRELRREKGMNK